MADNMEASTLLLIPLEIRLMVLRLLLIRRPYIDELTHMDARIVRVNRQLYKESLPVLYGENNFRAQIRAKYAQDSIWFRRCDDFTDEVEFRIPLYKLIRRYDIFVRMMGDDDDTECIKFAVRKMATRLSDLPNVEHLRIELGTQHHPGFSPELSTEQLVPYSHVLEPFRLLRNVPRVDIEGGVSTTYAQHLKTTMQGQTPVDHLPKMFGLFEDLIGTKYEYDDDLQRGIVAMNNDDAEEFKQVRAELVAKFVERTQARLNRLQDYDSDPDQRHWVIQQVRKSKRQK